MELKRGRVRYAAEQKQAIVARMMPPQNESVAKLSKETGVTEVNGARKHVQLVERHQATDKRAINGVVRTNF